MAQKRDEYEDDRDSDNSDSRFKLDKLTGFTAAGFIALCIAFFYLLSARTGANFGIVQVLFGLIAGVALTLFLLWVKFIMAGNRYMGAFISLAAILSIPYALTRKYQGVYTTTFMIIGIVLALFYTIFYFVKFSKK